MTGPQRIASERDRAILEAVENGHDAAEIAMAAGIRVEKVEQIAAAAGSKARRKQRQPFTPEQAVRLGRDWTRTHLPRSVVGDFTVRFWGAAFPRALKPGWVSA